MRAPTGPQSRTREAGAVDTPRAPARHRALLGPEPSDLSSIGLLGQCAVVGLRGGHWLLGPVPRSWRLAASGARGLVALAWKVLEGGSARAPREPQGRARTCARGQAASGLSGPAAWGTKGRKTGMLGEIITIITVIVTCIQCCSFQHLLTACSRPCASAVTGLSALTMAQAAAARRLAEKMRGRGHRCEDIKVWPPWTQANCQEIGVLGFSAFGRAQSPIMIWLAREYMYS